MLYFTNFNISLRTRIKARCHYKLSSGTDSFGLDSALSCAKMCSKCVCERNFVHTDTHMVDDISFVCSIHNKYLENGTFFVCLIVSGVPDIISLRSYSICVCVLAVQRATFRCRRSNCSPRMLPVTCTTNTERNKHNYLHKSLV